MNKLILYSFLVTLAAVGCAKEEPISDKVQYELVARMEHDANTKTSLSGVHNEGIYYPLWSEGDEIAVYVDGDIYPSKFTLGEGAGTTEASFCGYSEGENFYAVYPFSIAGTLQDGAFSLILPQTQQYVAGSFGPNSYPMVATGTKAGLDFKNLCAIMKISMTGEGAIRSITLTAQDSTAKLSGPATVSMANGSAPELVMGSGGSNSVMLQCNGIELSKDTPLDFHFVIPAQTYKGGFELAVDVYKGVIEKSIDADLKFNRSKMRHLKRMPLGDVYKSTDYSQDGTTVQLQKASEGNGINIVLMGDGYSDRQIADGTYMADMEFAFRNLFVKEPYKSFKSLFNVSYVNVVSEREGVENGNTALEGKFGEGTLVYGNDNACFYYAQKVVSQEMIDQTLVVVIMNSNRYAGTCYMYFPLTSDTDYGTGAAVAYFPKGEDEEVFAQLLHHEANGHGFPKLADEYAYDYMGAIPAEEAEKILNQQNLFGWWKNVDFTNDPAQVRWKKFLGDSRYAYQGLGIFEGGLTYWSGVWRPTETSIMKYNTGEFNSPSREAIYYRIHKLAYGNSWKYDYEKFVEWDAVNRKASSATGMEHTTPLKPFQQLHPPVVVGRHWSEVAN